MVGLARPLLPLGIAQGECRQREVASGFRRSPCIRQLGRILAHSAVNGEGQGEKVLVVRSECTRTKVLGVLGLMLLVHDVREKGVGQV